MADPKKTDPGRQEREHPTIKEQAKAEKGSKPDHTKTDKVKLDEIANPTKPNVVHGHNVNRTGPGGSK